MKLMVAPRSGDQATSAAMVAHGGGSEQTADVVIADVIAHAVLGVPGVAALAAGRGIIAGTYGPQRTVKGVVVRRNANGSLSVDVHVVVREAVALSASRSASRTASQAVLPKLAETIRRSVARASREAGLQPLASVDVYLDDLT
jgi:hypothetical protein